MKILKMCRNFITGRKMAGIPETPEQIFQAIVDDMKGIFGNDLLYMILYGSGASGHYIAGRSDINFLIILTEVGMGRLGQAASTVAGWRKKKVAVPLFMTRDDILSSLDSYPVEFLNITLNHVLVYGQEDILQDVSINVHQLRLQCERELKGKIFHLRRGSLEAEGKARQLRELIKVSMPAFVSLFKALLYMKRIDIPQDKKEMIQAVAGAYLIDPGIFLTCHEIREGVDLIPSSDIPKVFDAYMGEIAKLSRLIDRLKV